MKENKLDLHIRTWDDNFDTDFLVDVIFENYRDHTGQLIYTVINADTQNEVDKKSILEKDFERIEKQIEERIYLTDEEMSELEKKWSRHEDY